MREDDPLAVLQEGSLEGGKGIVTADPFGVDEAAPHAVGISLGAASNRCGLARAFEVVAAALKSSAARTRVI
jgi:hypothetical protein